MDPRSHRRLTTLTALTIAALLVLAGPAAARKKDPAGMVSEITDKRISESSGLALSANHDDLAYTMNDEGGSGAHVYAVQVSSGAVVGAADISSLPISDPESISVDADGMLWLGDLGDNDHERDDVAIYTFPEPGPGERAIARATRHPVSFPGGPLDVEGLLVHPITKQVHLVSKNESGNGRIFELPGLADGGTVQAREIAEAPEAVTDATYTHDGKWALLLTDKGLYVYDPTTWEPVAEVETPELEQGESVTVERGNRTVLVGSEGENSPIVRVNLPDTPGLAQPVGIDGGGLGGSGLGGDGIPFLTRDMAIPVGLVAVTLLAAGILAARRLKS